MNITYDSSLAEFFYETLSPLIKDRGCPFCGQRLNVNSFAGLFHYKGEPRLVHKNIVCLIQFSDYQKDNDAQKSVKLSGGRYACEVLASKWHGWRLRVSYQAQLDYGWPPFTVKAWVWKWKVK